MTAQVCDHTNHDPGNTGILADTLRTAGMQDPSDAPQLNV